MSEPIRSAEPTRAHERRRVAILGAGPVGLEAALAAAEAGLDFTVYEAGAEAAASVADWGHVRLFTPWELSVSPRQRRALAATGQEPPGGTSCPTGEDLRRAVLLPVAALPAIAPRLRLGTRVRAVGRQGLLKHEEIASAARRGHPFRLLLEGARGEESVAQAEVVLDCTGSWANPNTLGDGGIPAPGERALAARIVRRIPDLGRERAEWAGRTVLLVGAGHSAQTAARALAALAREAPGTRVLWALRSERAAIGAQVDDPLPERARLAAAAAELASGVSPAVWVLRGVAVDSLAEAEDGRLHVVLRRKTGEPQAVVVDRVLSLTGAVGDHTLYRQLQVHECYATSGPMKLAAALLGTPGGDCLAQTAHGLDALRSPEPQFFLLGAKSYGRNSSFLLRVGWEQVAEVMAEIGAAAGVAAPLLA